ncbi:MAG: hypothetical protein ACJATA_000016 [Sphingobacteriales bacterium]|jgi:hypothetical protein
MKFNSFLICILIITGMAKATYSQDTTLSLKNGTVLSGLLLEESRKKIKILIPGTKNNTQFTIRKKDLINKKEDKEKKPKNYLPQTKSQVNLISISLADPLINNHLLTFERSKKEVNDVRYYGILGINYSPNFDELDGSLKIFQLGAGIKQYLPIINSKRYFITWGTEILGTIIRSDFSSEFNLSNDPNTYTLKGKASHNFIAGNLLVGQEYWITPRLRLEFTNGYGYKLLMNYSREEETDNRSSHSFGYGFYKEQIRVNTVDSNSPFSRLTFTSTFSLGFKF